MACVPLLPKTLQSNHIQKKRIQRDNDLLSNLHQVRDLFKEAYGLSLRAMVDEYQENETREKESMQRYFEGTETDS